jgi:hypothetical protein
MDLTMILFNIASGCYALAMLSLARVTWYVGTRALYDRENDKRYDEIRRLEHEIMLELVRCASINPDAASILRAREEARREPPSSPHYVAFREMYCDFDVGGEPRYVKTQPEQVQSCDIAEQS